MAKEPETRSYTPVRGAHYDTLVRTCHENGRPVDVAVMKMDLLGTVLFIGPLSERLLPKKAQTGDEMPLEDKVDIQILPEDEQNALINGLQGIYGKAGLTVTPHYLYANPQPATDNGLEVTLAERKARCFGQAFTLSASPKRDYPPARELAAIKA